MAQLADTLTSRDTLRSAVLDDIVGRCQIAAQTISADDVAALDGLEFVSMGRLRDEVTAALLVELPPPSEKFAEVTTPATVTVSVICPECRIPQAIVVKLNPQLTVTNEGSELAVKAKSKPRPHLCGQLSLPEGDQTSFELEDIIGDDADPVATESIVRDMLSLVDEGDVDAIGVGSWDQVTLELVADYARAIHLRASDHDDVEIPDRPAVLDDLRCKGSKHVPGCGHFRDQPDGHLEADFEDRQSGDGDELAE